MILPTAPREPISDELRDHAETVLLGFAVRGWIPEMLESHNYHHAGKRLLHSVSDHLAAAGYITPVSAWAGPEDATVAALNNARTVAQCAVTYCKWSDTYSYPPGYLLADAIDHSQNLLMGCEHHERTVRRAALERAAIERAQQIPRLIAAGRTDEALLLLGVTSE